MIEKMKSIKIRRKGEKEEKRGGHTNEDSVFVMVEEVESCFLAVFQLSLEGLAVQLV